jgi:hypothetical protein
MSASLALSPVLCRTYNEFRLNRNVQPSGWLVGNMDKLNIHQSLELNGAYFVCAQRVMLFLAQNFLASGPGGGLIGGSSVTINAENIECVGEPGDPIQICAEDVLSLKAANKLTLRNVCLLTLPDTRIILGWKDDNYELVNLTILEMDKKNGDIVQRIKITSGQQFDQYLADKKKRAEDFILYQELQMEAVRKSGLKSILV